MFTYNALDDNSNKVKRVTVIAKKKEKVTKQKASEKVRRKLSLHKERGLDI